MMGFSSMFALLLVVGGGGGNELLDYIPTQIYWQLEGAQCTGEAMLAELKEGQDGGDVSALIKDLDADRAAAREAAHKKLLTLGPGIIPQLKPSLQSKSPEVAARVQEIIQKLSAQAEQRDIRRLMAIRSLGELKHRPALEALGKLTASKDLFVADYSRAAIAAIEGKPYARPAPAAQQRMSDVWLLPKNCAVVGQLAMSGTARPIDLDSIMKMAGQGLMADMNVTKEKLIDTAFKKGLIPAANKVGNLRLDLVTLGVSDDVGGRTGFVAVIGRGCYDAQKARAALRELCFHEPSPDGTVPRKGVRTVIDQVEVFCPESGTAILLPSDELAVFLAGPGGRDLPTEAIVRAVRAGKGTLGDNAEMAALIRSVDTSAPLWAVAKMTEAYRKESTFAPFDTMTLVGKQAGGFLDLSLTAKVQDAQKLPEVLKEFKEGLAKANAELARQTQQMPMMKPIADLVASIRIQDTPQEVKVTARMQQESPTGLMLMPWLMLGSGRSDEGAEVRPAPVPVQPVPAATQPAQRVRPTTRPVRVQPARPAPVERE